MKKKYFRPLFIIGLAFLFVSSTSCDWSSYEEEVESEIEEYENDREEE